MNWRDAFFIQAWSDYEVFREMNESRYPRCHKLHYLQMTTEKPAKGFLCHFSGGNAPAQKSHLVFSRFLKLSKQRRGLREQLGYERNSKAYSAYVDGIMPLAERIEKLAPVGGNLDRANPEYPWMDDGKDIKCPAEYDFPDLDKKRLADIYRLVSRLFSIAGFK